MQGKAWEPQLVFTVSITQGWPSRVRGITGHLLLNQDLHQVDVPTCCCCMEGSPQFIVLCIDVGSVVQEKLDYFFIVVYAALRRNQSQKVLRVPAHR